VGDDLPEPGGVQAAGGVEQGGFDGFDGVAGEVQGAGGQDLGMGGRDLAGTQRRA
jgi:hypothetical protein